MSWVSLQFFLLLSLFQLLFCRKLEMIENLCVLLLSVFGFIYIVLVCDARGAILGKILLYAHIPK